LLTADRSKLIAVKFHRRLGESDLKDTSAFADFPGPPRHEIVRGARTDRATAIK
jgi:hypothetical protein